MGRILWDSVSRPRGGPRALWHHHSSSFPGSNLPQVFCPKRQPLNWLLLLTDKWA